MAGWTDDELRAIEAADELVIATMRRDRTLRSPVIIWVIRHGDDLYVRSVNGRTPSSWFLGALERHQAHIQCGGVDKDVQLGEVDELEDEIEAAYREKYVRFPRSYVDDLVTPQSRAATLKLVPRS